VWSPQFHPVIKRKDEYFKKKWKEHPNPFEDDILKPILPEPEK